MPSRLQFGAVCEHYHFSCIALFSQRHREEMTDYIKLQIVRIQILNHRSIRVVITIVKSFAVEISPK